VKLVHLVGFIAKKVVTMHGHMDVKVLTWMRSSNLRSMFSSVSLLTHSLDAKIMGTSLRAIHCGKQSTRPFPFVCCSEGVRNLNIAGAMTFLLSAKVCWTDRCCGFDDALQGVQLWALHLVVIRVHTDGFQPPVTDGQKSFSLNNILASCVRLQMISANALSFTIQYFCVVDNTQSVIMLEW